MTSPIERAEQAASEADEPTDAWDWSELLPAGVDSWSEWTDA